MALWAIFHRMFCQNGRLLCEDTLAESPRSHLPRQGAQCNIPEPFPCAPGHASLQIVVAPCSQVVRSIPNPSMSESPVLRFGNLGRGTHKAKDYDTHRRSVSAQASLYRSQETQCLIPHDRYYLHATASASSPTLIQPVQATVDCTPTNAIQKKAPCGCRSLEAPLQKSSCDMHRKVQQCQNLLNSRTDSQKHCSQKHCSGLRQPQSLSAFDLTVPDMQVNIKGFPAQHACVHEPPTNQHMYPHKLVQISHGEPPPSFRAVPSVSFRETVSDGPSLLADLKVASCLKKRNDIDLAAPRSISIASSSDDLTLASSTCSSDRCVSDSI